MRLHLTSTTDNRLIRILRRYAGQTRDAALELVDDADRADVIVFAETVERHDPHFERVHRSRSMREHPERVVLYNEDDKSRARLPAVAVNAIDVPWQLGIGCLPIFEDQPPLEPIRTAPTTLMSFVGSRSSRVRKHLVERYASTHRAVIATDSYDAWRTTPEERATQRQMFESTLAAGLFTLCPKGGSTSSLRLYEAMQAGRCPVILADEWVEDVGVDWSFALRVAEKDVGRLEEILHAVPRDEALERGAEGRRCWEAAYAPDRYLVTLAEAAQVLVERRIVMPPRTLRERLDDDAYRLKLWARRFKRQLTRPARPPEEGTPHGASPR